MGAGLVEEATRRGGVLWLRAGDRAPQLVWHVWHDGAAQVVHGPGEQPLEGVSDGDRVLVVVRDKERQADRLVQWWARVEQLRPGTPAWDERVPALAARRLNAADSGAALVERWAATATVLALHPDGTQEPVDRG